MLCAPQVREDRDSLRARLDETKLELQGSKATVDEMGAARSALGKQLADVRALLESERAAFPGQKEAALAELRASMEERFDKETAELTAAHQARVAELQSRLNEVPVIEQIRMTLRKNAARVIDMFREWDINNDGQVSKEEFRRAMPLLGLDVPTSEVDRLFDEFDKDGGGEIGMGEMNKLLRRTAAVQPTVTASPAERPASGSRQRPSLAQAGQRVSLANAANKASPGGSRMSGPANSASLLAAISKAKADDSQRKSKFGR